MENLAVVFGALRLTLEKLQEHYAACDNGPLPAQPQDLRHGRAADLLLPYPLRAASIGTAKLVLGNSGPAKDFFDSLVPGSAMRLEKARGSTQLLYLVQLRSEGEGGRRAVVKFCPRPFAGGGELVHRLWAEEEGLAPELIFVHRLPGGIDMVGMEYLDPAAGWVRLADVRSDQAEALRPDVRRALAKAHALRLDDRSTVHGDVRPPNVMVRLTAGELKGPRPICFVDFDWAGVAGVARCPGFLNKNIKWPAGMQPGELLTQDLDRELLATM